MMPPKAQHQQPLLWQPPREPRPPREINLDDLEDASTDANGKDAIGDVPSALRDGGSVTRRDATE